MAQLVDFLLDTEIGLTGETFALELTDSVVVPSPGVPLGTTQVGTPGHYSKLTIKTGTGEQTVNHFVGYWTVQGT